jgi:recombination protein RecT
MSTAIQPASQSPINTLRGLLEKSKEQIALALPRHLTPERMIRVALTAVQRTPKLQECDALSVVGAVVQASQLGLEPDGILGQAYLVPYWNGTTRRMEAQLQPGYKGLIALARRSGEVSTLFSELVYERDRFKVVKGDSPRLIHEPDYRSEDRGELMGAYAVVVFKDGGKDFEYMPMHELNKIRASSKAKDKQGNEYGPWVTHPEEMYRKCPIRRLAKRLPLSPEFQRAAAQDEYVDAGVAPSAAEEVENSELVRVGTELAGQKLLEKYGDTKQQPIVDALEITDADTQPEQGDTPNPQPQPESAETPASVVESATGTSRVSTRRRGHQPATPHGQPLSFGSERQPGEDDKF